MKEEIKDIWVKALRSGTFKQTTGKLKDREDEPNGAYCCLGVLCELSGISEFDEQNKYCGEFATLPPLVREWAGLVSDIGGMEQGIHHSFINIDGEEDQNEYSSLTELNDDAKYDFNQIADVIEEQWKSL